MSSTTPRWQYLLYPELKRFEPSRQAGALKAAADIGFEAPECVGLAIALTATVLLTRYSAADMGSPTASVRLLATLFRRSNQQRRQLRL